MQTELKTSHEIRDIFRKNNDRLKNEVETLAKIVRTSRNHFKELEVCDFDGLTAQLQKYEKKIKELQLSESQIESMRAAKAKQRIVQGQKKAERDIYNKMAIKRGFAPIKTPFDEKPPKLQLKDLMEEKQPKIYNRQFSPPAKKTTSIEDVVGDKSDKYSKFILFSKVNESSVKKGSEIFQTAKIYQSTDKSDDWQAIDGNSTSVEAVGGDSKNTSRRAIPGQVSRKVVENYMHNGLEPFTEINKTKESDATLLIDTVTNEIDQYLDNEQLKNHQDKHENR